MNNEKSTPDHLRSFSKVDLIKLKRQNKNMNIPRDCRRVNAAKNSMWYDLNVCNSSWEQAIHKQIKTLNNKKNAVSSRIIAYAILKVADYIESHICVELHEVWNI